MRIRKEVIKNVLAKHKNLLRFMTQSEIDAFDK